MSAMIYITEDDEGIREMVQIALENFLYQVKAFENAEDTLTAANIKLPDLFIFDIMLPGMNGIEAVKKLKSSPYIASIPILFLTAKDTELDTVVGLDAGGDDYLTKPFGLMELSARVRALLRRNPRKQTILSTSDITLNLETREVYLEKRTVELTYKEFEMLTMLMKNANRVIPREELLNTIWGYDFAGETRTLDTHIKSLRQKLGDSSENPKYILTIRNVGYRFREVLQ